MPHGNNEFVNLLVMHLSRLVQCSARAVGSMLSSYQHVKQTKDCEWDPQTVPCPVLFS
jgi:hypothetical protein